MTKCLQEQELNTKSTKSDLVCRDNR